MSARTDFGATRAQREVSFDAETDLLLLMADAALSDRVNRCAFRYADEVLQLGRSSPRSTVDRIDRIQATALERGTVTATTMALVVLPLLVSRPVAVAAE